VDEAARRVAATQTTASSRLGHDPRGRVRLMVGDPPRRRATYQDVLDAPENMVAEVVDGELHLMPRPRRMLTSIRSSRPMTKRRPRSNCSPVTTPWTRGQVATSSSSRTACASRSASVRETTRGNGR
jgi:hypothetical protein